MCRGACIRQAFKIYGIYIQLLLVCLQAERIFGLKFIACWFLPEAVPQIFRVQVRAFQVLL